MLKNNLNFKSSNIEGLFSKKLQQYNMLNFFRFFSSMIEFKNIILLVLVLYLIKYINKQDIFKFLLGVIFIILLKNILQRERPFNIISEVNNLDNKYFDKYSFPSGHSFTAFFFAFILTCKMPNIYLKNSIIILAFTIALSRVYLGVHYLSDITFSMILAKILADF